MKKTIILTLGILLASISLFGQGLHITNWSHNGEGSNTLFAGDTILFSYRIENQDAFAHQNCTVSVSSLNPNVEFLDSIETFDYIGAGNQYQFNNSFKMVISPAAPNQQVLCLTIQINSDQGHYTELITYVIISYNLKVVSYNISDENHNFIINHSESDSILFNMKNMEYRSVSNVDLVLRTNTPGISIVNGTLHIDTIYTQEEFVFPTKIQASSSFEDGITFDVFIDVLVNNQLQSTLIVSIIGTNNTITFEEGCDISMLNNPLNFPSWYIDNSTAYSGIKSLRSGSISHYDSTAVQYEFTTLKDGVISFAYKISTESNYDWLYFYLDGEFITKWSGVVDWSTTQHAITAGSHTALWIYIKDKSVSNYSDCVWIDDIRIPDNALSQATFNVPTTAIERTLDRTNHNTEDVTITLSNTSDPYILFDNNIVSDDNNLVSWVSVSPSNGSINGHQQKEITLHFSAEEQLPGDYNAHLEVRIDQLDTIVQIPLILHVQSLDAIEEREMPVAVSIFPNPTNGCFTINSENENIQRVSIYDISGKIILQEQIQDQHGTLDLTGRASGIYLLKIETNQGTINRKVILQ